MKATAMAAVALLAMGVLALGQVVPKGIIVEPPAPGGLQAEIWVEKPVYAVGEYARIHFRVNQDAYVYIWDISPDGVCLIFPNQNEMNNYVTAGEHTVPGPGKEDYLRVSPPTGTEYLQLVATKRPVGEIVQFFGGFAPGSPFACSPAGRQAVEKLDQVKGIISQAVPENERAFDFTYFEIVSAAPPQYGTLVVETTPPFAELYVDNAFRGWTPKTLTLTAGWHDVLVRLSGYRDWSRRVYLVAGRTRRFNVVLTPIVANRPPVADFTFSPKTPQPGQNVRFDASASYDPDGTITAYQWDFDGDGTFDAAGVTVFHSFGAPGSYNVRLVVTDDRGASGDVVKTVNVVAPNRPPVANFIISPSPAMVGYPVTFDATASYDPDGFISDYRWDFNGDGVVDGSGQVATYTYFAPGTYRVTLYVTDNMGATAQSTQILQVVTPGPAGMPPMDGIPGVYIWGTDTWKVTVNGAPSWTSPHRFRIELRTNGTFVNVSSAQGPAPLGLVPEPVEEGWKVVFEGEVSSNRITYTFEVQNATMIYFDIKLDMDGDGNFETSPGIVRLRQRMVNPPVNPFVVGLPEGYTGPFVPSINFRIGTAFFFTQHSRFVFWLTTIEDLEGRSI